MSTPENAVYDGLKQLFSLTEYTRLYSVYGLLVRNGTKIVFAYASESVLKPMEDLGIDPEKFIELFELGTADARIFTATDRNGQFLSWTPEARAANGQEREKTQIFLKRVSPITKLNQSLWSKDSSKARDETVRILQDALPDCEVR